MSPISFFRLLPPGAARTSLLFVLSVAFGLVSAASRIHAAESETMAERTLKRIVEHQKELFAAAAKQGDKAEQETFRVQFQSVAHEYELLLQNNPKFAAGYAAYGYMLGKVGMSDEATKILLKANELDPDIPLVKNQLGNALAEQGKPLQAAPYYIAAIKLAPEEPLYHYQLGTLLVEARDQFVRSGEWSRAALDKAMHEAFKRATDLAPDRFEFAYRYAESFYDLENPDWNEALKLWSALEEKAPTAVERQTMRLHAANICVKLGKLDHARALLGTVEEPALQIQKQKVLDQIKAAESAGEKNK
jgi:tetratricopeptide (TPR) repeat protein